MTIESTREDMVSAGLGEFDQMSDDVRLDPRVGPLQVGSRVVTEGTTAEQPNRPSREFRTVCVNEALRRLEPLSVIDPTPDHDRVSRDLVTVVGRHDRDARSVRHEALGEDAGDLASCAMSRFDDNQYVCAIIGHGAMVHPCAREWPESFDPSTEDEWPLSERRRPDWVETSDEGFPQMTTRSPALARTTDVADGPETVISIAHLVKTFGPTTALDQLDLQVERGEVHGFLGPNGAGKTVTIRILLGLLRADRGSVTVLGGDPWTDGVELHRRLAYVPGDVSLWPNLSGGEIIDFLLRLRGRVDRHRRDELIERFELDPRKKSRTYSKGNRQKVALVAALASGVELLILDEPTSGLDPLMESVFQKTIGEAVERGVTVLLSSHILAEVETLCDRVTIIREGRAVRHGTLAELRAVTRTTVTVATDEPPVGLEGLKGVYALRQLDGHVQFEVDGDELDAVVRHLAPLGVRSLVSHPPTLEDLFLRLYSQDSTEVTR